jgi:hypothetical protein
LNHPTYIKKGKWIKQVEKGIKISKKYSNNFHMPFYEKTIMKKSKETENQEIEKQKTLRTFKERSRGFQQ